MSDQSHALRVRTFVNYLQKDPGHGLFVYIIDKTDESGDERDFAVSFPTTLRRLQYSEFDKIALHGHRLSDGMLTSKVSLSASRAS